MGTAVSSPAGSGAESQPPSSFTTLEVLRKASPDISVVLLLLNFHQNMVRKNVALPYHYQGWYSNCRTDGTAHSNKFVIARRGNGVQLNPPWLRAVVCPRGLGIILEAPQGLRAVVLGLGLGIEIKVLGQNVNSNKFHLLLTVTVWAQN